MNKIATKMRRGITLACAVACAFFLASCGPVKENSQSEQKIPGDMGEYTYVAEYLDLNLSSEAELYHAKVEGDRLYYTSYHYDDDTDTSTEFMHIHSILENRELAVYEVARSNDKESQYQNVAAFHVNEDGSMTFLMVEGDYSDSNEVQSNYYFIKYDENFNELSNAGVSDEISEMTDNFYIQKMLCDKQNRYYLIGDNQVYLFDADFAYKGEVTFDNAWFNGCGTGKDGAVYVCMYDATMNDQVVKSIDFDKKTASKGVGSFVTNGNSSITPGLDGDLMVNDGSALYDFYLADGHRTKLLSWLDCDIYGEYVQNFNLMEDGRIMAVIQDWSTHDSTIAVLSKVKRSEVALKKEITIGVLYENQELLAAAVAFNKQSSEYRIHIKNYIASGDYSDDAYANGETALLNDVISSNCPDLVDVSQVNVAQLTPKGVFENLDDWLSKSSALSRDSFVENTLNCGTVDGKLIYIPKNFYIEGVVGKKSIVGDGKGWTLTDLMNLTKKYPDAQVFYGAAQEFGMYWCMEFNQAQFIDYANGKCNFDSPEFKQVLEFVGSFPKEYEWNDDDDIQKMMSDNAVLLETVYIHSFQDIQMYPAMFGEEVNFIGFPTVDGKNGNSIHGNGGVAILSKSQNKEGAWAFVEFMLRYDNPMYSMGFPTDKTKFQKKIDNELNAKVCTDENGDPIYDEMGNPVYEGGYGGIGLGTWEYQYRPSTVEEIEQVNSIIANAQPGTSMYVELMDIINEEASPYFAGQKSVDEVAKVIQSRVQIYLNENQ